MVIVARYIAVKPSDRSRHRSMHPIWLRMSLNSTTYTHTPSLQLRLGLRLSKDRLHLRRLHHVALDLELALHEQVLRVRLARHELREVGVVEDECDCKVTSISAHTLTSYRSPSVAVSG